jgi:preprotein translocase subunit SecE
VTTENQDERRAVSDEPDGAGSPGNGEDTDTRGQTAVVTQPMRPTGKRSRRGAVAEGDDTDTTTETKATGTKNGGKGKKTAKRAAKPPRRNPFAFVWNYLKEVIAELRKVIWPNRKQMVTYTSVVLIFLAFMVTLIGLVDLGLVKLVTLVFG